MALLTLVYLPRESSFRVEELKVPVVGEGPVGVAVAVDGVVLGGSGSGSVDGGCESSQLQAQLH